VRAVQRLAAADAVLYDDLSSGPILSLARKGCDLVGVGKRAGRASPKQDHVSRLLVDYARAGQRVVRLKPGDAGLFGRLEEELEALSAAEIPFEIVPGVPSPCAAAAAAGIPLTRRLAARRVQFLTGADVKGGLPDDLNWAALTDAKATTVIFMGKRTFPELAQGLIARGLDGETPAMLAHSVSTPDELIERFTVSSLARHLQTAETTVPALILYGALYQGTE
jgi:uroporphyrin-III C-methyltransferase